MVSMRLDLGIMGTLASPTSGASFWGIALSKVPIRCTMLTTFKYEGGGLTKSVLHKFPPPKAELFGSYILQLKLHITKWLWDKSQGFDLIYSHKKSEISQGWGKVYMTWGKRLSTFGARGCQQNWEYVRAGFDRYILPFLLDFVNMCICKLLNWFPCRNLLIVIVDGLVIILQYDSSLFKVMIFKLHASFLW